MENNTQNKENNLEENVIEIEKKWKEIHPDFTSELQKEWEDRGFDYWGCKSWIDYGCQPQEAELARYLLECQRNKFSNDVETGRTEYPKWKELGFELETIISWKKWGFTGQQATEWTSRGCQLSEAQEWRGQGFNPEQTQECLEFGLTPSTSSDYFYYCWLKNSKQLTPQQVLGNEKQLREEYNHVSKKTQQWLDQNYPNEEKTYNIYINQQLEGVLDCSGYDNLRKIFISHQVDSSKFEIKKSSYKWRGETQKTKIIHCVPAQEWLDKYYPKKGTCLRKRKYGEKHEDYGQTRTQITKLDIRELNLEGSLDLSDFPNLEELRCYENKLTSLNVSKCDKLKELWCSHSHLTQIPYPTNPEQLTTLNIGNNKLLPQDLTFLSQFRNLEGLWIYNNLFFGSLEPLKDLIKLRELDISYTDLNSGVEYLPNSLEKIEYNTWIGKYKVSQIQDQLDQHYWKDTHNDFIGEYGEIYKKHWLDQGFTKEQTKQFLEEWNKDREIIRPQDGAFLNWFLNFKKLDLEWAEENEEEFRDLRDKYKYFGTCEECQQPNTSEKWCQTCNGQHFQQSFPNWTGGNTQIDAFIQQCQLEATSNWNVLEWIPYEQFKNVEHIANGGFGKVEKTEWERGPIANWNSEKKCWMVYKNKTVALKTLSNSQNLNTDFLQEITFYKAFRSSVSNMVPCYGVSKDREGNYILVMEYMKEGNLREYLKKNYRELDFKDDKSFPKCPKLNFLQQIIQGLKDIHRKKLVHRDFHSGNIIVDAKDWWNDRIKCHITDLGLCKPANETDNNNLFGVMPYMAPEVLQNKPYTQSSDIYSFGIIAYEILTCLPPFAGQSHDANLALKICQGERPQFPEQVKYPQILIDLIKRCWDNEPSKRPVAREISRIMSGWFYEKSLKSDTTLYQQIQESEEHNKTLPEEIRYPKYQDNNIWHSKPINAKQITELLRDSKQIEFTIPEEPNLQADPQEQSSHQAQIEIPPKK